MGNEGSAGMSTMATTDIATQQAALSILIVSGATVVGYLVYLATPKKHLPLAAGILAAIVVVAGLSYAGVRAASDFVVLWASILGVLAVSAAMNDAWGE